MSILIPSFSHASWTTRSPHPRQKKTGHVARLEEKRNKPKASKSTYSTKRPIQKRHRSRSKRLFWRFRHDKTLTARRCLGAYEIWLFANHPVPVRVTHVRVGRMFFVDGCNAVLPPHWLDA